MLMVLVPLLSVAVGGSKNHAVPNSTVLFVLLHVITGAVVSTTFTVWLQRALRLLQLSTACQVRVASKVPSQWPAELVTVLTTTIVLLPLLSVAVGGSKVHAVPISTVLFVLMQLMTGEVVSSTFTRWLQREKLPQASVACQVRVTSNVPSQCPVRLVTVLTSVMV